MRRAALIMITGTSLALLAGTTVANAKDGRDDREDRPPAAAAPSRNGISFELEIDPELDAEFGPRRVNAAQAAAIVADAFPGAQVTEAELDERDGGPIWEMTFNLGVREREVDVDADNGTILGSEHRR